MKNRVCIVISLLLFVFAGCSEKLREEVVSKHPNGEPYQVYYYNSQNQCVREVDYYNNGAVYIEGAMENNLRSGEWTSYFLDGKVQSKGYYVEGIRTGKSLVYHSNGNLWMDGWYKDDHKCGEWIFYDEQGYEVKREVFGSCD